MSKFYQRPRYRSAPGTTSRMAGNNLYYPATAGFDLSTGLGTPNLPAFFNTLVVNPGQR